MPQHRSLIHIFARVARSRAYPLVAIAIVGLASACTVDVPTATEESRALPSPVGAELTLSPAPGSVTLTEAQLNAQLEREKTRIALAELASKGTYDRLKGEWEVFLKSNPSQSTSLFLTCDPIAYAAQVKIIGSEGGDIGFGPHKLSIPRGSLSRRVVITTESLVSLNVETRFSPHGLVFNASKPPRLELSYKHCYGQSSLPKSIVYVNDSKQILEYPTSTDVSQAGLVWAWIKHFSGYMVSSGRSSRN